MGSFLSVLFPGNQERAQNAWKKSEDYQMLDFAMKSETSNWTKKFGKNFIGTDISPPGGGRRIYMNDNTPLICFIYWYLRIFYIQGEKQKLIQSLRFLKNWLDTMGKEELLANALKSNIDYSEKYNAHGQIINKQLEPKKRTAWYYLAKLEKEDKKYENQTKKIFQGKSASQYLENKIINIMESMTQQKQQQLKQLWKTNLMDSKKELSQNTES